MQRFSSAYARLCGSGDTSCFGSRLLFVLRQTGRLAVSCVSIPPGRDRHSCVLAVLARLSALAGSLRVWPFLCGDLDGVTGDAGTRGTGLAAQHLCAFAQAHWLCYAFRGEYVGAPRPKPAPKSLRLSGLSSRCGGVMLVRIRDRRHPGTRVDPPGSDLWPGGSCCIVLSFLALRGSKWNRHCRRAAPKRRRVGLRARSGVRAGSAC